MMLRFVVLAASFLGLTLACDESSTWNISSARSVVVDLRDQSELDQTGTLPCAGHIPYNGGSFEERFRAVYGDGTGYDTIYLFCRSGGRAGAALNSLQAAYSFGGVNIVNLGGYTLNSDWRQCGSCPLQTQCPDPQRELSMRQITSGTGTRCEECFSDPAYNVGTMSSEQCNAQCEASETCNFVTYYGNGTCYHTPTCTVVNCAANIWQKDAACPATEEPTEAPAEDLCTDNPFLSEDGLQPVGKRVIKQGDVYRAARVSLSRAKKMQRKLNAAQNDKQRRKLQRKIDTLDPSTEAAQLVMDQANEAKRCAQANRRLRQG